MKMRSIRIPDSAIYANGDLLQTLHRESINEINDKLCGATKVKVLQFEMNGEIRHTLLAFYPDTMSFPEEEY